MTAAEIKADLVATKGKLWFPDSNDDGSIDIDAVLGYMKAPGTATKRMLESAGGFGIMDYSLASKMDRQQYTVTESDGKYFLWCQNGVDWGASFATVESSYTEAVEAAKRAKKEHDSACAALEILSSFPEEVDALETEKKSLEARISSLGFFKGKEKKPLKARLAEVQAEISAKRKKLEEAKELAENSANALSVADKTAAGLKAKYETAKKEIAKKF